MNPVLTDMLGFPSSISPPFTYANPDAFHSPVARMGPQARPDMAGVFPYKSPIDPLNFSLYSTNGIPTGLSWQYPTYGNGVLVALQGGGSALNMRSLDKGRTWQSVPLISGGNGWKRLCFGNGFFLMSGGNSSSTNSVLVSIDGFNWYQVGLPSSIFAYATSFANGRFVVSANTGTVIYISPVGVSMSDMIQYQSSIWTARTLPSLGSNSWRDFVYGDGVWAGLEQTGNIVLSYDNGTNWQVGPVIDTNNTSYFLGFGGGLWVSPTYTAGRLNVADNPAGPWRRVTSPLTGNYIPIYFDGVWFLMDAANQYVYSVDQFRTISPVQVFPGPVSGSTVWFPTIADGSLVFLNQGTNPGGVSLQGFAQ